MRKTIGLTVQLFNGLPYGENYWFAGLMAQGLIALMFNDSMDLHMGEPLASRFEDALVQWSNGFLVQWSSASVAQWFSGVMFSWCVPPVLKQPHVSKHLSESLEFRGYVF